MLRLSCSLQEKCTFFTDVLGKSILILFKEAIINILEMKDRYNRNKNSIRQQTNYCLVQGQNENYVSPHLHHMDPC